MKNDLGKIHVYTGNGKGKTTAALGLALRAIGTGYKVCLIQFLKAQPYGELKSLKLLPKLKIKRFGEKTYIHGRGSQKDKRAAQKAIEWARKAVNSRQYDLIILDEVFLATFFKLIKVEEIVELIKNKPKNVELILTGRKANQQIIKLADYVTEMKEIKHPYQKGVRARKGIEQ